MGGQGVGPVNMQCPYCKKELDNEQTRCWRCGADLAGPQSRIPATDGSEVSATEPDPWSASPAWDDPLPRRPSVESSGVSGSPSVPVSEKTLAPSVGPPTDSEMTSIQGRGTTETPPALTVRSGPSGRGPLITALLVLGALALKGKGILLFLLGKAKLLLGLFKLKSLLVMVKSGGSMLIMVWAYALLWPWQFALGATLLLLVHELGHALVLRHLGVKFSAPIFIPFLGALIGLKEMPRDAAKEALMAYGGPFLGTVGAQVCFYLYFRTEQGVFLGLAQFGYMINLFNLLPFSPLDGGRIVGAISPRIWLLSLPLLAVVGLYLHSFIVLLVALVGLPRAIAAWRGQASDQPYYQVSKGSRLLAAVGYLGLALFLASMMYEAGQLHAAVGNMP